jgi:hypothetical protein
MSSCALLSFVCLLAGVLIGVAVMCLMSVNNDEQD